MDRYRFALRPKWIASHVLVLVLVVTMINLGFWQLRRLHEKRSHNLQVTEREALPVADVGTLLRPGQPYSAAGDLAYRQVRATGTYVAAEQVLVRGRSLDGTPGSWVVAPLDLGDGTAVVVNRGWIANNGRYTAVPSRFAPPAGRVTVQGLLLATQTRGSFGSRDPATGHLDSLARVDVARLQKQVGDLALLPGYVQLLEQRPPITDADPRPVPVPVLDEGPHLSYAIQWFFFTSVALVGYPLILRRAANDEERRRNEDGDAEIPDDASVQPPDGGRDDADAESASR